MRARNRASPTATNVRIFGRVVAEPDSGLTLRGFLVEARNESGVLAATSTDRAGRFEVECGSERIGVGVVVALLAPSGIAAGQARLLADQLGASTELIFRAPLPPAPGAVPGLAPLEAPDRSVIPAGRIDTLYRAASIANIGGLFRSSHGALGDIGWIHHVERELEDLERIADEASLGDVRGLDQLRSLLETAPELNAGDAHHDDGETQPVGELRPRDAAAVIAVGTLLDLADDTGTLWRARAAGLVLSRISAVESGVDAAQALLAEDISAEEFVSRVGDASPYPHAGHGHGGHGSSATRHEAHLHVHPRVESLAHCLSEMLRVSEQVTSDADVPVVVGEVVPSAVAATAGGSLQLRPRAATAFPTQSSDASFALWDGVQLRKLPVSTWSSEQIEVTLPEGVASGCAYLTWQTPPTSLTERIAEESAKDDEHCRQLFPTQPGRSLPPGFQAAVSLIGPPRIVFTANGSAERAEADAGAEVTLRWRVDAGICPSVDDPSDGAPPARVRVDLLADEEAIVEDAPATGRLSVRDGAGSYTLRAETFLGRTSVGTREETVEVEWREVMTLHLPERIHYPDEPITVTVDVRRSNADEALDVQLNSPDETILPGGRATVPPGATSIGIELVPAGAVGATTLTGTARDGELVSDPVEVRLGETSCIEDDPRWGGRWEIAQVTALEQEETCAPAGWLDGASATVYGAAGTLLNKVGTQVQKAIDCFTHPDTTAADQAGCDTWATEQDAARGQWVETRRQECAQYRDDGYSKCAEQRDQGYNRCSEQRDQGYNTCCTWWPCSWLCSAWVWVSNIVCVAWTWVSNIVCVAWTWVSNIVCVAWTWIVDKVWQAETAIGRPLCKAYAWVKNSFVGRLVCAIGEGLLGLIELVAALVLIVVAAVLRTLGGLVRPVCDLVNAFTGAGPSTKTSSALRVVGIHLALLHTGEVIIFSYDEGVVPVTPSSPADPTAVGDSDRAVCAIWNPITGRARYVRLDRNLFCSHHCFMPDGRLFVVGGQFPLWPLFLKSIVPPRQLAPGADRDLHLFDPVSESWQRIQPDLDEGRWYPTTATLPDGKAFVISGTNGYATMPGFGRGIRDSWVIVDPQTNDVPASTSLGGGSAGGRFNIYHTYPFVHVLPEGVLFVHYKRFTRFFDPRTQTWTLPLGQAGGGPLYGGGGGGPIELTRWPFSRTGPGPGTCVLLPLAPEQRNGAPHYRPGRIMILGGGGAEKASEPPIKGEVYALNPTVPATDTAEILDLSEPRPRWRYVGADPTAADYDPQVCPRPMRYRRVMPDAVLLPDGKVLVVSGGTTGQSGGFMAHVPGPTGIPDMGATGPVRNPELFDPETESWEVMCPKPLDRLYHATALLLPDGRVLVAGHDGFLNMEPYDSSRYELEIYSPPYLFRGPRPTIRSAPTEITYGQRFAISTPDAADLRSVALVRASSITHQINTDQRHVKLQVASIQGDQLVLEAPPNGAVAPPGYYMLFIVNARGVPSVAHWVRVPVTEAAYPLDSGDGGTPREPGPP